MLEGLQARQADFKRTAGRGLAAASILFSPLATKCTPSPREVRAESEEVAATATAPPKEEESMWIPKEKDTPFGKHELRFSLGDVEKQSGELVITINKSILKQGEVFGNVDQDDLGSIFRISYGFRINEEGKFAITVLMGVPYIKEPINMFTGQAEIDDLEQEHEVRFAWENWQITEATLDGEKILPESSGPVT